MKSNRVYTMNDPQVELNSGSSLTSTTTIIIGNNQQKQQVDEFKPVTIMDLAPVKGTKRESLASEESEKESNVVEIKSNTKTDTNDALSATSPQNSETSVIPPLTCTKKVLSTLHDPEQFATLSQKEKQLDLCEREYGCGLLHTWKQQVIPMCEKEINLEPQSSSDKQKKETNLSTLTCYKHNNKHLTPNSFPHTVCESDNLIMDFSKLKRVPCLKYRPGYFCKRPTYYTYLNGALLGKCKRNLNNFDLSQFSKDFSKEIFSGFQTFKEARFREGNANIEYVDGVTIFVSREQDEHVNLYHAMSDFFATYLMLEMFNLDSNNVQIVLLDEHYDGPFDFLWNSAFSFKRPMKRASEFRERTVRFERAIFQHAGSATHLKSNLMDFSQDDSKHCKSKLQLISAFADRIMYGLGVKKRIASPGEIIRGIFISRQPANQKAFMARRITNEEEIVESLQNHPEYNNTFTIEKIDFAKLSLIEQVKKVHNSDFLIGFHGAGLAHSLFLPEGTSAILEIWKSVLTKSWRSYEQLTLWKGNAYMLWSNTDKTATRQDMFGDYLTINVQSFYQTFGQFLNNLKTLRVN